MVIKPWVAEAAADIHMLYDDGLFPDDKLEEAAELIAKHCPFKPDTAYLELKHDTLPGVVNDWATRAAIFLRSDEDRRPERIAAVIATFAAPHITLLCKLAAMAHASTCAMVVPCGCADNGEDCECDPECNCPAAPLMAELRESLK